MELKVKEIENNDDRIKCIEYSIRNASTKHEKRKGSLFLTSKKGTLFFMVDEGCMRNGFPRFTRRCSIGHDITAVKQSRAKMPRYYGYLSPPPTIAVIILAAAWNRRSARPLQFTRNGAAISNLVQVTQLTQYADMIY